MCTHKTRVNSFSEYEHNGLAYCVSNNVLYLVIKWVAFILCNYLCRGFNTSPETFYFTVFIITKAARLHSRPRPRLFLQYEVMIISLSHTAGLSEVFFFRYIQYGVQMYNVVTKAFDALSVKKVYYCLLQESIYFTSIYLYISARHCPTTCSREKREIRVLVECPRMTTPPYVSSVFFQGFERKSEILQILINNANRLWYFPV